MLNVLTSFHHRAAQRITGMTAKCATCREWEYPELEEVMDLAGLYPILLYLRRGRQP